MHPPPRPGRAFRPGSHPGPLPRQLHGSLRRRHRRQGRQHALRRSSPRVRRHGVDAARHGARRLRAGACVQDAQRAAGRNDLLRRGLDRQRPVARGDEPGRRPASPGRLHAREQPVRLLDPERPGVRGRPGRARAHLRVPRPDRRRQRRRGRVRRGARGGRARPRGRRADSDRVPHDANARPRRARRHELRAARDVRGVVAARPDRPVREAPGGRARVRQDEVDSIRADVGEYVEVRRGGAGLADARSGARPRRRLRRKLGAARGRPGPVVALGAWHRERSADDRHRPLPDRPGPIRPS